MSPQVVASGYADARVVVLPEGGTSSISEGTLSGRAYWEGSLDEG